MNEMHIINPCAYFRKDISELQEESSAKYKIEDYGKNPPTISSSLW